MSQALSKEELQRLIHQLINMERISTEELQTYQIHQLKKLLHHHRQYNRMVEEKLRKFTSENKRLTQLLEDIPILTRESIQLAGHQFYTKSLPQNQLPISESKTSGSTGKPVTILKTRLTNLLFTAHNIRELMWHKIDLRDNISSIRANITSYDESTQWAGEFAYFFQTGLAQKIPITTDIAKQVELLNAFQPTLIITYPTNLDAIIRILKEKQITFPKLKWIKTIGETLPKSLRELTKQTMGIDIIDCYSSQEMGLMTLQCPVSGLHHLISDSLIIEILNENQKPCQEGEIGRVVVTDLYNYLSPMIRYDIGDFAKVGPRCPCGRNMPTISQIMGRTRNLILKPDNTKHWPLIGIHQYKDSLIRQYQLVQEKIDQFQLHIHVDHPMSLNQKTHLLNIVKKQLDFECSIQLNEHFQPLPKGANGKFEEFISKVETTKSL